MQDHQPEIDLIRNSLALIASIADEVGEENLTFRERISRQIGQERLAEIEKKETDR
jgi:hypothetical protein